MLENTVLSWSKLVKGILKQDALPDHIAIPTERPGPLVETAQRAASAYALTSLLTQLRSDKAKSVLSGLEAVYSAYTDAFVAMEADVTAAQATAVATLKYVKTLQPWFEVSPIPPRSKISLQILIAHRSNVFFSGYFRFVCVGQ